MFLCSAALWGPHLLLLCCCKRATIAHDAGFSTAISSSAPTPPLQHARRACAWLSQGEPCQVSEIKHWRATNCKPLPAPSPLTVPVIRPNQLQPTRQPPARHRPSPAGTAKSELSRRLSQLCGGNYFERLLTRFSVPEELFGPLSMRGGWLGGSAQPQPADSANI